MSKRHTESCPPKSQCYSQTLKRAIDRHLPHSLLDSGGVKFRIDLGMTSHALDIEQPGELLAYLRATRRIGPNESVRTRVLAGGVSNRTVLVERPSGEAWVLKQALAKLRVAVDWFSDPARIEREALGLRWLARLAPPGTITPLVFEDAEHHLLAMQAVPQPHDNWKEMLLAGEINTMLVDQFAALIGAVHRRAAESKEPIREIFGERTYFESLRIEPYYLYTAQQVPLAHDFLEDLVADTRCRQLTLVHGDYSPKNILVYAGRMILLDHEVIHWGDPAFDVGFALTHLLSKAHHLPLHRRRFVAAAARFVETYAATLGPVYWDQNLEAMIVRHTLGCLLARVAGRSPLEYLTPAQRDRQRDVAVSVMVRPPPTFFELLTLCAFGIGHAHD